MSTSTYFLHLIQKRSRPVGYAAEYLTCGSFAALIMGFLLLMFMRILYHISLASHLAVVPCCLLFGTFGIIAS